jgi:hypothetical protein
MGTDTVSMITLPSITEIWMLPPIIGHFENLNNSGDENRE